MSVFTLPQGKRKVFPFVQASYIIQIRLQRSRFISKIFFSLIWSIKMGLFSFPSAMFPACFSESFNYAALISPCYSSASSKCQLFLYQRRAISPSASDKRPQPRPAQPQSSCHLLICPGENQNQPIRHQCRDGPHDCD